MNTNFACLETPMRIERALATSSTLLFAMLAPVVAHAHPGGHADGFAAGLAHPFLGLDHLLAMIAVGVWAAQLARTRRHAHALWALPLAFVGVMTLAAFLAVGGTALPAIESGVAASVLVLGLLIAARSRLALPAGLAVVALFAVFHGYAHGAEMPAAASLLTYGAGFALATAALHGVGIAGAHGLAAHAAALRWVGAGIAAAGATLLAGL